MGGVAATRVGGFVGGGLLPGKLLVVLVDLTLSLQEFGRLLPEAVPVLRRLGASSGANDFKNCAGSIQ